MTNEPTTGEIVRALRFCYESEEIECYECPCRVSGGAYLCHMDKLADRLESQEQKIERLTKQNKELVETVLRKIGVSYSKNVEGSVTFCGLTMDEAVDRIMQFPSLTARAEQAELERDAAVVDMKSIVDAVREEYSDGTCCFACKYDFDTSCDEYGCCPWECPGFESNDCFEWRGLPQEGEGKK